ncbi:unnamed protein product [Blepharisma stoltei]|uniref:EF-hand domain-containing protein n=1 Tax=Blepharisma stoltei TaxID=1481888 RepID=A0AAU9IRE7_9CILI|nr:unnamed protein product [Blepharisma stoltei]
MSMSRIDILRDDAKFDKTARILFDQLDRNKSGALDRQEIRVALLRYFRDNNLEEPSDIELNKVLKDIDLSGSGEIDFNLFKNSLRRVLQEETR